MLPIELQCVSHQTASQLPYQLLHIHITTPDGLIEPADLKGLQLPESLIWSQGVVIEGRAPVWLYGYLVHACHPAAWVACFDPRLGAAMPKSGGAVVVATHSQVVAVGEILAIELPDEIFQKP